MSTIDISAESVIRIYLGNEECSCYQRASKLWDFRDKAAETLDLGRGQQANQIEKAERFEHEKEAKA